MPFSCFLSSGLESAHHDGDAEAFIASAPYSRQKLTAVLSRPSCFEEFESLGSRFLLAPQSGKKYLSGYSPEIESTLRVQPRGRSSSGLQFLLLDKRRHAMATNFEQEGDEKNEQSVKERAAQFEEADKKKSSQKSPSGDQPKPDEVCNAFDEKTPVYNKGFFHSVDLGESDGKTGGKDAVFCCNGGDAAGCGEWGGKMMFKCDGDNMGVYFPEGDAPKADASTLGYSIPKSSLSYDGESEEVTIDGTKFTRFKLAIPKVDDKGLAEKKEILQKVFPDQWRDGKEGERQLRVEVYILKDADGKITTDTREKEGEISIMGSIMSDDFHIADMQYAIPEEGKETQ